MNNQINKQTKYINKPTFILITITLTLELILDLLFKGLH